MDVTEFIKNLRRFVIDDDLKNSIRLYKETKFADVTDEKWKEGLLFYNNLDKSAQEQFFSILRHIKVDTMSLILGVLDGNMILENQEKDLVLFMEGVENPVNGELQDIFLEMEERNL